MTTRDQIATALDNLRGRARRQDTRIRLALLDIRKALEYARSCDDARIEAALTVAEKTLREACE